MARSQEALDRRAEKRSVPIENQRLNDRAKKARKNDSNDNAEEKKKNSDDKSVATKQDEVVTKQTTVVKKQATVVTKEEAVVTKKSAVVKNQKAALVVVQPVRDTNDWICTKCTNKNFHHRESCNRCQESRNSQIPTAAVTSVPSSSSSKKAASAVDKVEVEVKAASVSVAAPSANGNWTCASCKNDNFPTRTACNRCQADRPAQPSSSHSNQGIKPTDKKISTKPPPADKISKGKGPVSGKSLSWGKQASEAEMNENKRLREVRVMIGYNGRDDVVQLYN